MSKVEGVAVVVATTTTSTTTTKAPFSPPFLKRLLVEPTGGGVCRPWASTSSHHNGDPLSISADFDCDVDTESDNQQLSVVEVEGSTFTEVTLESVPLALRERP